MRRTSPELTDEDLTRLARLGGAVDQIAEAAGIDAAHVQDRLAGAVEQRPVVSRRPAPVEDALVC